MCWVPTSQDPYTAKRSHAGTGHFLDVIDHRPNYDVLVLHRAIRVQYAGGAEGKPALNDGPPRVEIKAEGSNTTTWITATREVIISAGALNTPLILQRSGIGPKGVLERAGVKQIVDLPGVGQVSFVRLVARPLSRPYTTTRSLTPLRTSTTTEPSFITSRVSPSPAFPSEREKY
jgi:hypothetical protein